MFAPPKSLLALGAGFLTRRTAKNLQDKSRALPAQKNAFDYLVGQMARCSEGRDWGLSPGLNYADFQSRVPPRTYEGFSAAVERMKKGEADVLWPGQCQHYAVSSGTTAGRTKYLPVTPAMLDHFKKAGLDSLLYYSARVGSTRFFKGKHLFLGGSTTLTPIEESKPFIAYAGDLSGITALNLPRWAEAHLYEPGTVIAQMSDWPTKIQAIADRTLPRNITLLAGIPSWLLILSETLRAKARAAGRPADHLQQVWPNLECLIHGGVPIGPYVNELRAAIGPKINFHEVYPASEGFIAAQDGEASGGLRLMTEANLFFEFLPMADFDETRLDQLGSKAVPLEGVRTGVDYALLLTTPAGLCRYVIGDVVRFVSTDLPHLIYVGRTKLQLSAFGEHVIEKELTDTLTAATERRGWSVVQFHVAPLFVNAQSGQNRGQHEWWIELKAPVSPAPDPAVLAAELDAELIRLNDDYEAKRKGGGLLPPRVHLVAPGVFEQWMRQSGKWGGQNKMPRCRSDRQIADGLAGIASR